MTERGHTPPTFPPGDTEPTSGCDAPSRLPSSSAPNDPIVRIRKSLFSYLISKAGLEVDWDSGKLPVGGAGKQEYRPDRQTRKVVRRLEKQGHHMVADVVRSYREHPAKGKSQRRIRWDNIAMYIVAILLPVLLVGGEWWRKYVWVCLCVAVIVSLVSKPRKRHD